MDADAQFDLALKEAVDAHLASGCPERLAAAIDYAVFPGGHRIRPRLTLAVAQACGMDRPALAVASAAGLELLHCASLVHDDMPCFDNAEIRRGKPSVQAAFGEPLALLAGDALIVMAFQVMAASGTAVPARFCALTGILAAGVGAPRGIVAGQAWECEPEIHLETYHRAKTGALFAAATMAGAAAAGAPHEAWALMGERIGEAYQVADDLLDRYGDPDVIGKPVERDAAGGRPNCVSELGLAKVTARLKKLIRLAEESVPHCPGRDALKALIRSEAQGFVELALGRRQAA